MQRTPFISGLSFNGITMKDPGWERSDVLEKLTAASTLLERSMDISLIPENGAGLAYAISGARDKNGVAAVQGGIAREKGKTTCCRTMCIWCRGEYRANCAHRDEI